MEPIESISIQETRPEGPVGALWLFHPKPEVGESLFSWVSRIAECHGVSLECFCREVWPGEDLLFSDLERKPPSQVLEALEGGTGISRERLLEMSLVGLTKLVLGVELSTKGWVPWVVPAMARRKEEFGLQFCPDCLAMGDPPVFDLSWRLAFVTICPIHNRLLVDQCPRCKLALNPRRPDRKKRAIDDAVPTYMCHYCGWDLRKRAGDPKSQRPMRGVKSLQGSLLAAARNGWFESRWGETIHSIPFFKGLQRILRPLVSKGAIGRFRGEAVGESGLIDPSDRIRSGARGTLFERQDVLCRHQVLALVNWVLDSWPDRFVLACQRCGVRCARLTQDCHEEAPYWIWKVAHEHLRYYQSRWRREFLPTGLVVSYLALGERMTSPGLARIRDRIVFTQEHPELWDDPFMLAAAMRAAGLYSQKSAISVLGQHCSWLIDAVQATKSAVQLPGGLVAVNLNGKVKILRRARKLTSNPTVY
ncbi:MAG: TniQ family protein [Acidobacteria bacterium]|nr:TniQ family protein [Acidobacteriota bacterium]